MPARRRGCSASRHTGGCAQGAVDRGVFGDADGEGVPGLDARGGPADLAEGALEADHAVGLLAAERVVRLLFEPAVALVEALALAQQQERGVEAVGGRRVVPECAEAREREHRVRDRAREHDFAVRVHHAIDQQGVSVVGRFLDGRAGVALLDRPEIARGWGELHVHQIAMVGDLHGAARQGEGARGAAVDAGGRGGPVGPIKRALDAAVEDLLGALASCRVRHVGVSTGTVRAADRSIDAHGGIHVERAFGARRPVHARRPDRPGRSARRHRRRRRHSESV